MGCAMTYDRRLGKPKPLRQTVLELVSKEALSIDAVASRLALPRDKARLAMENLVSRDLVVHVGKTAGNRYIYRAVQPVAVPRVNCDPAASWLFNEVLA